MTTVRLSVVKRLLISLVLTGGIAVVLAVGAGTLTRPVWSTSELNLIRGLWIGSLTAVPPDPSDRVADDAQAVVLGRELFFDARFSINGYVSCATCHRPDKEFQDGLPRALGVAETARRTQPLSGAAYGPWYFWDGRKDSLWAQALTPLEGATEHGGNRWMYAHVIRDFYRQPYEALFGPIPVLDWTSEWMALSTGQRDAVTRIFVNMGKAIEAYERTLLPEPSRFDDYAQAILKGDTTAAQTTFTTDEAAGLRLFLNKGNCVTCHKSPLLSDHDFHNTGVPAADGMAPDPGWATGLPAMLDDEFGCKGRWSDAGPAGGCADRRYLIVGMANQPGAFQTPSLRGVAERAPYMHAGQFKTLQAVLTHYNAALPAVIGRSELKPLGLSEQEQRQLLAFLLTLSPAH